MPLKMWTIRLLVALLTFIAGITVNRLSIPQQRTTPVEIRNPYDETAVMFEGVVLKIGPSVPPSGGMAFYRLAKYRVDRITYGHYEAREIVVDHLSLTTHELDELREGMRVCVAVERNAKIFSRFNVEGIREENETVDAFYGGLLVEPRSCD
jgi:hypothetical protein